MWTEAENGEASFSICTCTLHSKNWRDCTDKLSVWQLHWQSVNGDLPVRPIHCTV